MAIGERLSRYRDFARLLAKYHRLDASADPSLPPSDPSGPRASDADQFAHELEALGPVFIKLGQLLASRADLLPERYLQALGRLHDDVTPFAFTDAIRIVEDELAVKPSKAFREFDEAPIAAASLGQVHRAVLRDGREVAVKIQRPGVRERVFDDLNTLGDVAQMLERSGRVARSLDLPRVLDEFHHAMLSELDYRQEARHMSAIAHRLRRFERIVVPRPVDDFTSAQVLTMDYIAGVKVTKVSAVEWTEIDGAALAHDVFRAYLQQVLIDGFFHADPHPGNVLLTDDHRLALVDLGLVGRLSNAVQERLFRLVLAIADGRGDEAGAVIIGLGTKLDDFDEAKVRRTVAELVDRHQHLPAKDLRIGRVMLEMARSGHQLGLRLEPELALLGKTFLNLDEIGRILDPEFDVNASMRRNAVSLMRRRLLKKATPAHMFSSVLEIRDVAERLPARINRILEALASNDLRLKIEVIDHGSIIDGFQKVANRIALALVLAALIVGAAMLTRVPTSFTILGYPGFAMLLFLAAAAGGFWMAWTILAGDVKRTRSH